MAAAVSIDGEHAPLMAQFEQLPPLVNDDADLVRRGAWVDLQPLLANLQYFKDVLAAPRRLASGAR